MTGIWSAGVNRHQVTTKLQKIFREVLDPEIVLRDDLDATQVETWDSLNHITLIVEIEQRFGIELTTDELAALRNVGEMIDLLVQKLPSA
jgi:acyl carrier protein